MKTITNSVWKNIFTIGLMTAFIVLSGTWLKDSHAKKTPRQNTPSLNLPFDSNQKRGEPSLNPHYFPVPHELKDDVIFWLLIYTQLSEKRAVIHDKAFPLLIYDTIGPHPSNRLLDKIATIRQQQIIKAIKKMNKTPCSQWSPALRTLYNQMTKYLSAQDIKTASERVRAQQGMAENFVVSLYRSIGMIDTIQSIFRAFHLPTALCYLPHVESSFHLWIQSDAGAVGLWQLTPIAVERRLQMNTLYDQRRDPIQSTIAAAEILSYNYKRLQCWPLAITAYNCGMARVIQAVKTTGSYDLGEITKRFNKGSFGFASSNFYSCFYAVASVAQKMHFFIKPLSTIQWPYDQTVQITLSSSMRVSDILQTYNLTSDVFQRLNPSYSKTVLTKNINIPAFYCITIPKARNKTSHAGEVYDDSNQEQTARAPTFSTYLQTH